MFEIDKYSRIPIYEQLIRQMELLVSSGELQEGAQLPSTRMLSQQLAVNPNTLQKAYAELERRGLCYSVPGSGRFISKDAQAAINDINSTFMEQFNAYCVQLKKRGIPLAAVINEVKAVYGDSYEGGVDNDKH